MRSLKIIVTTENTELWCNLANSFDETNIKFIESYSDLESETESSFVFCKQPISDVECLVNDLKSGEIESAIVFYQQSELLIAESIAKGESLNNSANNWLRKNQALLKTQKQNRRNRSLVPRLAVRRPPLEQRSALALRLPRRPRWKVVLAFGRARRRQVVTQGRAFRRPLKARSQVAREHDEFREAAEIAVGRQRPVQYRAAAPHRCR